MMNVPFNEVMICLLFTGITSIQLCVMLTRPLTSTLCSSNCTFSLTEGIYVGTAWLLLELLTVWTVCDCTSLHSADCRLYGVALKNKTI